MVDRTVIDLFAGTGALGLEALSRGARHAIFVEKDRECVGLIFRNVATLRYEDRVQVRLADAYRWARTFQPADNQPLIILLDAPDQEYERRGKVLNQAIAQLVEKMPGGSVIALAGGRDLDERILADFDTWDIRRYSSMQIAIKVIAGASAQAPDGLDDPAGPAPINQDGGELEADLDE